MENLHRQEPPQPLAMLLGHDRALSLCLLGLTAAISGYLLFWLLGLPFVEEDHALRLWFPSPLWAVVPAAGLVVLLVTVVMWTVVTAG